MTDLTRRNFIEALIASAIVAGVPGVAAACNYKPLQTNTTKQRQTEELLVYRYVNKDWLIQRPGTDFTIQDDVITMCDPSDDLLRVSYMILGS